MICSNPICNNKVSLTAICSECQIKGFYHPYKLEDLSDLEKKFFLTKNFYLELVRFTFPTQANRNPFRYETCVYTAYFPLKELENPLIKLKKYLCHLTVTKLAIEYQPKTPARQQATILVKAKNPHLTVRTEKDAMQSEEYDESSRGIHANCFPSARKEGKAKMGSASASSASSSSSTTVVAKIDTEGWGGDLNILEGAVGILPTQNQRTAMWLLFEQDLKKFLAFPSIEVFIE